MGRSAGLRHAVCLAAIATLAAPFPADAFNGRLSSTSPPPGSSFLPGALGYPVTLASGANGGVWYGGALNDRGLEGELETVERIDYITPGGRVIDLPFPASLERRWPEYFAHGTGPQEWFLAEKEHHAPAVLSWVTPAGYGPVTTIPVSANTRVRGLAVGSDGNLWTTATRVGAHHVPLSAILRVTPGGQVTSFTAGLRRGAIPADITAGPRGALWFSDHAGYIGRVTTGGAIHEYRIPRPITDGSAEWEAFQPARPIVADHRGLLWFIVDAEHIGRMDAGGRVAIFAPHSSYPLARAGAEKAALDGLAVAPDGRVWFTRESGEVARIDRDGRATTVTDHLATGRGIAFMPDGSAWIGIGPAFVGKHAHPAELARIAPGDRLVEYPSRPECRVPALVGYAPGLAEEELTSLTEHVSYYCEERISIGHIARDVGPASLPLVVVAQHPRAGSQSKGYRVVDVSARRVSPLPRHGCRAPWPFHRVLHTAGVFAWQVQHGDYSGRTEMFYACARPQGPAHVFAETGRHAPEGSSLYELTAAGRFLAYQRIEGNQYGYGGSLTVYDARRGRRVFRIATDEAWADSPDAPPRAIERLGQPAGSDVAALALSPTGAVAWVGFTNGKPEISVLYMHDRNGTRRITSAARITAVAFAHAQLTWVADGVHQSALE